MVWKWIAHVRSILHGQQRVLSHGRHGRAAMLRRTYGMDWCNPTCYAIKILDAKYDAVSIEDVVKECMHLSEEQRADLQVVLSKFQKLFSGKLGVFPYQKFHIELDPGARPKHVRPYAIPRIHLAAFKKELEHLDKIGVLSPTGASEWGSPTFITPRRMAECGRSVTSVNSTKLYAESSTRSQSYQTSYLDARNTASSSSCYLYAVLYLWAWWRGKRCDNHCHAIWQVSIQRLTNGPQVLTRLCTGNNGKHLPRSSRWSRSVHWWHWSLSDDWKSHMILLEKILQKLQDNSFSVNPLKCSWAVQETDWLGYWYWLTPSGLKPWKKKIDAVLKMAPPKNVKQLPGFIGMVNYYRDMSWPHRAHILAPLTAKTGTPKKGAKP